jgi:hypothetical protein
MLNMNKELKYLFDYDVPDDLDLSDKNILCDKNIRLPVDVIEYLVEKGYKIDIKTWQSSIYNCDVELMELLFELNCSFNKYSLYDAAYEGHMRLLEVLLQLNYQKKDVNNHWSMTKVNQKHFIYDADLLDEAKEGGCPECIDFVYELLD